MIVNPEVVEVYTS